VPEEQIIIALSKVVWMSRSCPALELLMQKGS